MEVYNLYKRYKYSLYHHERQRAMDRIDWQILQRIYTEKSMSRVAEKLFISQPAVSYRLAKMESEYQRPLFIRTTKGVQLTEAGLRLHRYALRMLQLDNEISAAVQLDPSEFTGHIRVGSTPLFMSYFLIDQLHEFCELYKNISVFVELHPSPTLYNMFDNGELPVAIIRGNRYTTKEHHCECLLTEPLLLIAKETITHEYLQTHPFIQNTASVRLPIDDFINEWLEHHFSVPPPISHVQTSGDSRIMVQLVKSGFGWTIIGRSRLYDANTLYNQPIFRPDGSPYEYKTQLFYSSGAEHWETYRVYIQHLKTYFETHFGGSL